MYCGDSEGCDIEHFWPKKPYPSSAFVWNNLLWICQPCNRRKSRNFPLSPSSTPLILDPSVVNPWAFFIFVDETGEIVPRPGLPIEEAARAEHTIDPRYTRVNIECVSEGRRRDTRTLRRAAVQLIAAGGSNQAEAAFVEAATDLDHPELVQWFLSREGAAELPFVDVLIDFPIAAANALRALSSLHPGL
jgi:uncharacterized protein (TIGR02646 family)